MKKLFLLCLFVFQGCMPSQPKVENASYRTAVFSHSNFLSSCVGCHETKRPVAVAGVAHGGGADCASCHRPPSWAYSHNPMPTSCNSCHDQPPSDRPLVQKHLDTTGATVEVNGHYTASDCVSCHTPATGTYPTAWAYKHSPQPTSCSSCHDYKRPAPVGGIVHGSGGDCVNCHTIRTWQGFNHTPTPASCNSCHDTGGTTPSRPTTRSASHNTKLSTHYSSVDCKSCHATPQTPYGNQWNAGASQNCLPCHQSKGQNEHGASVGNCYPCHRGTDRSWD